MSYVMVPVPEEYAKLVADFLRNRARVSEAAAEPGGIERSYALLDDVGRRLLDALARARLDKRLVSVTDIAVELGCSPRELVGWLLEVNAVLNANGGPPGAVLIGPPVDGRAEVAERALHMATATAEAVVRAREELEAGRS